MSLYAARNLVRPAAGSGRASTCKQNPCVLLSSTRFVARAEQSQHRPACRRWKSSSSSSTTTSATASSTSSATTGGTATAAANKTGKSNKVAREAERQAYLRRANEQMKRYHDTRERMRRGELKNVNAHRGPKHAGQMQAAVAAAFLAVFACMPFLGRRIARDDEFRNKWVPAWYDYTVQKPENPWTREELHEQMLAVQMQLRERAIKGDFAPEKLKKMQSNMRQKQDGEAATPSKKIPKAWDTFQPAMGKEEEYNEG